MPPRSDRALESLVSSGRRAGLLFAAVLAAGLLAAGGGPWGPKRSEGLVLVATRAGVPGDVLGGSLAVAPRAAGSAGDELPADLREIVGGLGLGVAVRPGEPLTWRHFARAPRQQPAPESSVGESLTVTAVMPRDLEAGDTVEAIGFMRTVGPGGRKSPGTAVPLAERATIVRVTEPPESCGGANPDLACGAVDLRTDALSAQKLRFVIGTPGGRLHLVRTGGTAARER